jgi:hypothetical protein
MGSPRNLGGRPFHVLRLVVQSQSRAARRRRAGGRTVAVLAVGAMLAAIGVGPRRAGGDSLPPEPRLRPAPVFASIERAWVIGSADSVLAHVGQRKVYISLPDAGPEGGTFSRAQTYFILERMFDATRTEEFSFVSIREPEEQPASAVGRAERTFRRRDSSRLQQDRIFVSLLQEADRWIIAEIKSVR